MAEDAEAEIRIERRESQRRIRKMKTEAEWDKKEARQKAQEERDAILAATSKEIATAQKEIERAVKKREATRDAIGEAGGEIAERWAQYRTRRNDLYLTPSEYRHQAEAYKKLLLEIIDNENYDAKRHAIREYAEELGIGDRAGSILKVLTEKVLKRTIPPYYFIDERSGQKEGAYYFHGGIRLRKDSRDWSGAKETLYHETGHYLDETILKRRYAGRRVTEDPYGIQEAFKEDKRRLNRSNGQGAFKIGDILFVKEEFRAQNNGRGFLRINNHTALKLETEIASKLGCDINDMIVQKYASLIYDAIQSVLGYNWGDGHVRDYVNSRLETYIEAIAQITGSIAGYDFLSDILPNAYGKIKEIYEAE